MAWSKIIESDIFKVNNVFELWMNKSEIKLLLLLIWELWMVNYSPKDIHFHEICVQDRTLFSLPLLICLKHKSNSTMKSVHLSVCQSVIKNPNCKADACCDKVAQ